MSNEISPCPFCGSIELEPVQTENDDYQIYCHDCYATGPQASSKHAASKAWNTRTED